MTPSIIEWVRTAVTMELIPHGGKILEVGSRNVNGSVRDIFDQANYTGIDLEKGPGVDLVVDLYDHASSVLWGTSGNAYDMVICLESLEHMFDPVQATRSMRMMLKNGGTLLVSVPTTGFPEHRYPKDYWRFMRDAFTEVVFFGMNIIALAEVKCPAGYPILIGAARK